MNNQLRDFINEKTEPVNCLQKSFQIYFIYFFFVMNLSHFLWYATPSAFVMFNKLLVCKLISKGL